MTPPRPAEVGTDRWIQTQRVRFLYADDRLEIWSLKKGLPDRCIEAFDHGATTMILDFLAELR